MVAALMGLVVVVSHWSLIWHHPVPDFDTDTLVGQSPGNCGKPWIVPGMGDSAHPLGNALIQQYICLWDGSSLVTTFQSWALLLVAVVAVAALLLVLVAHRSGGGALAATAALGYLGVSPVLRTLSARAEEDWIGLTLFLLVTVLVLSYHRAETRLRPRLVVLGLTTMVLAVWHFQYLLVLAFGLTPWALLALLRPGLVGTTRRRALEMGVAMAAPAGLALGALMAGGYTVRAPYHRQYHSIFNPDYWGGVAHWVRNYVTYSSRWLTGWLGNDGQQEKLFAAPTAWPFVVLGAVALALVVALLVSTRSSVIMAIGFGCLVLPFLFEPHNAERWDPTALIVALALAYGAWARPAAPVPEHRAEERPDPEPEPERDTEPAPRPEPEPAPRSEPTGSVSTER